MECTSRPFKTQYLNFPEFSFRTVNPVTRFTLTESKLSIVHKFTTGVNEKKKDFLICQKDFDKYIHTVEQNKTFLLFSRVSLLLLLLFNVQLIKKNKFLQY